MSTVMLTLLVISSAGFSLGNFRAYFICREKQELTEPMVSKDKSDNKDIRAAVDLVEIWVNQEKSEMLETMVKPDQLDPKAPPEVMVPVD